MDKPALGIYVSKTNSVNSKKTSLRKLSHVPTQTLLNTPLYTHTETDKIFLDVINLLSAEP